MTGPHVGLGPARRPILVITGPAISETCLSHVTSIRARRAHSAPHEASRWTRTGGEMGRCSGCRPRRRPRRVSRRTRRPVREGKASLARQPARLVPIRDGATRRAPRDGSRRRAPSFASPRRTSASPRPTRARASVPLPRTHRRPFPGPRPGRSAAAPARRSERRVVAGEPDDARGDHRRRAGAVRDKPAVRGPGTGVPPAEPLPEESRSACRGRTSITRLWCATSPVQIQQKVGLHHPFTSRTG